ncbi:MAG: porin [Cyanomargarita calcarea GSE-NOS-MK-12-04C]|jgi:hypothetical protein|uniref:Porin n=1 Tax=Cyanomargarita calcarea GSE-NOS-MK-12-04C TaxID=2839659 RepID=A0A951QKT6_9CYAN|nr:porin [Cyanomargarita calcarea GSE-NOS-MK-12-04C]
MSQPVLDCHKFTSSREIYRVYLLLCTASASICWVLAVNEVSIAQVNPSNPPAGDLQVGFGGLLPVPQSPLPAGNARPSGSTTPPPPLEIQPENVYSIGNIANPRANLTIRQTPANDIKQLENSFIQGYKGKKTPAAQVKYQGQTNLPLFAAGGEINPGLTVVGTSKNPGSAPTFNQLLNVPPQAAALPSLPGTAPGTPTFNQLLNAQTTAASGVPATVPTFNQLLNVPPQTAALPPLPATAPGTPTFNQLLNAQTTAASGVPATVPTFNQLLNSQPQTAALPPLPGTAPTFNQQINAQTAQQPLIPGTTSQEFTAPGAGTFNQLINSQPQATPLPTLPGMATPPATQPTTPRPVTQLANQQRFFSSSALKEPSLMLQGVYVTQGGDTSARARLSGVYPLTPQLLFGATLDLTSEGSRFDDSRREGLNINELYFATSLGGLPNLRVVAGQIDLTSYFDRNSFSKDGASQFFNPVFQTNPALSATGISSRPALLLNWSVTDNIDAKAAVFSSSDRISDFALDGFAGEIGIRYGNAIIRGTYASDRDGGNRDTFPESFGLARNTERTVFGPLKTDREEAYGLNAEVFIPNLKLGFFGRYGRYENRDLGKGADTYTLGASLVDLFTADDRLGLAYGRALSNESLHRGNSLDVLEMYYDFQFLPNLRLGFSVQGRDDFGETVVGVRVKSEFDVTPRGRIAR